MGITKYVDEYEDRRCMSDRSRLVMARMRTVERDYFIHRTRGETTTKIYIGSPTACYACTDDLDYRLLYERQNDRDISRYLY